MRAFDINYYIVDFRKQEQYEWMNAISADSLRAVGKTVVDAYNRFFNKIGGHPRFKSKKKAKISYPLGYNNIHFDDTYVRIPKIGLIKYKTDFDVPIGTGHKFTSAHISQINDKWYVSYNMQYESQVVQLTTTSMGIDLGIKELAVVSFGDQDLYFHNINKSEKMKRLIKRHKSIQKQISRKYAAAKKKYGTYVKSNNIRKLEAKAKKLMYHMTGIRNNYIHHITHALINLKPNRVVMEDLDVLSMMKNKHMSKYAQYLCLYEIYRQMEYKCERNGIEFIVANRYFPSSKTCSCCGNIKRNLKLSDRIYTCEKCGMTLDRDLNAAMNLAKYTA